MTARHCETCTACCEGWLTSKHIEMSPGKPCTHCTAKGCAIYENRPQEPCVSFSCGWLQEPDIFPDNMRPDECGAIILWGKKWNEWRVIRAVPTGERIPEDTLEWLKSYARQNNIPLLFIENIFRDGKYYGLNQTGYGPPAFTHAVKNEIHPEDIRKF